jgi:hypothetical protein
MSAPNLQYPPASGGGTPVGGSGAPGTIPVWSGTGTTLGDSQLVQSATGIYTMTRNIGIGIDPGAVKLRITVGNAGEWTMRTNGSTTAGQSFGFLLDAGTNASDATLQLRSATGAATHMFVRGDGNVGIGTASPQEKAQVSGNLKVGVTASDSFITFGDEGTTSRFNGIYRPASSNTMAIGSYNLITFNVSATNLGSQTERMRIDSSGNVTIGLAGSGAKLEVTQILNTQGGVRIGLTAAPKNNYYNAELHYFRGIDDLDKVIIDSVNKYVNASVATWGLRLPATPGNGNANTLDAYQEGTRVLSAGDLSGWTYVTATQYWTLVGRTVTLHTVFTGGTSSATGGATIATPPLLTPLRIAAGAAVNSSGTALGNGVAVVGPTSGTTGTVTTSNAISSSAVDKVITVTYETAGL